MNNQLALIDSSFLYSLLDQSDKYHQQSVQFLGNTTLHLIIPEVSLTEIAYLLHRKSGSSAISRLIDAVTKLNIQRVYLRDIDLARITEILIQYREANFDFVDVCIMALSERLEISQICTYDRRDFSIFRTKQQHYLTLIP